MIIRNSIRNFSLLAILLTAPALHAQTATAATTPAPLWETITGESTTIAITLPAGTTYRFGDSTHNLWSESITVSAPTTISPVSMSNGNPFPFSDPDYGTVKELDVLETTGPQTISVTNLAVSPAATVAQIVPPLVPPTTVPVLPGTSYTLTFSNFATSTAAGQNSLMLALVNAPASDANQTWEGTQMNLTIDGVTLVCTYGQTYTNAIFSLTCTVPQPANSTTGTSSGS
jgi:hypothetical protein